ncbi:hypothetical protein [Planococcus donghaensis]|uniref:DUF695 domain-containing protein n=1 Tax=Planococcus donghaensis TaxID=414778 RepID=A0A1C7EJV9_9BACL|nr:hypothetical protein [Planococcus donghaensis]ANU24264.1 hypothetical protein BCM40_13260 [Planococcus donghaensis]
MNWLPRRKNKVTTFWEWFVVNEHAYLELEGTGRIKLLNQLEKKLQKVNKHLAFEMGEIREDGKREFVISADGMVEAFDDVIELVKQAPKLSAFDIIAFRQKQMEEVSIAYGDIELGWDDLFCTYEKEDNNGELNLILYVKGFNEENEDEFVSASFILLDTIIGEYNVGMHIGEIEFTNYMGQPNARPVKELQNLFLTNQLTQCGS